MIRERTRKAQWLAKANTTSRKGIGRTLRSCVVSPAKRVNFEKALERQREKSVPAHRPPRHLPNVHLSAPATP